MKQGRIIITILLTTIWISISEFVRNEFIVKSLWIKHYSKLGLTFPSEPVNGAVWGLWSLLFAIVIFILARKFTVLQTALIGWLVGFAMMWVAIGNLGVLPYRLLIYAIPLSFLEAYVASYITNKLLAGSR
jgi:hypothetical protein